MLVIDSERAKRTLNETEAEAIGWWTKQLLKYMYGDDVKMIANLNEQNKANFIIKGQYKDVKAYAKAVAAQKEFLDAYVEFGTDHDSLVASSSYLCCVDIVDFLLFHSFMGR